MIILIMNACFLARAIVYQYNTKTYQHEKFLLSFDDKTVSYSILDKFIDFQQIMMVIANINWSLNIFFDVIVLKMLMVYFTFQAKSRE